ncbi:dihydroxy-acid dehydratase 1 [Striga asiatica]|uniref:Dihydroxy-acid dehydratase 1 n=1 Tax=Striga asiatica TaxID=4170 RepID=A0A5A7NYA1_STRAF|nr:dihydroxy-acid dehydratase 1 [Striga asiatica]
MSRLYTFVLPSLVMNLIFCARLCNSRRVFYDHMQPLKSTELVSPSHLFAKASILAPDNSRCTLDSGLSDCENKNPHFSHPNILNAHDLDHYHIELSKTAARNPPNDPLERGPVPPSDSSGCTYIPGGGGPDCNYAPPRHYISDTYGLQLGRVFYDHMKPLKSTEFVSPSNLFAKGSIPVPDNSRCTLDSGLSDCENKNPQFSHSNILNAQDLDHYHIELSKNAARNPPIDPLERGPVPPSDYSGCTYIPGGGGPDCNYAPP